MGYLNEMVEIRRELCHRVMDTGELTSPEQTVELIKELAIKHNASPYHLSILARADEEALSRHFQSEQDRFRHQYGKEHDRRYNLLTEGAGHLYWKNRTQARLGKTRKVINEFKEQNPDIFEVAYDQTLPEPDEIVKRIRDHSIRAGVDPRFVFFVLEEQEFCYWDILEGVSKATWHGLPGYFTKDGKCAHTVGL